MISVMRLIFVFLIIFPVAAAAQCDVVATVFEKDICQVDITPPERPGRPLAKDRKEKIEKIRLGQLIRMAAAKKLLPRGSYTPDSREIDIHQRFTEQSRTRMDSDNREVVETIEKLLKAHRYDDRRKKSLEQLLAVMKRSLEQAKERARGDRLRDEDMRKRFGEKSVQEMKQRIEKSRRRISEQWVSSWKMNQALYKKYGGRIIFQQAGIEPIDAYKDYLKDIREKGKLKIVKPAYADVFDEFDRYLAMGHNFLPNKDRTYFDRPYWETTNLETAQRERIQKLKDTPHL